MADPITMLSSVIGGLVSVFAAYTTYKAAATQAAAPAKTAEVTAGEAVAAVVEPAIATHGNADDHADLANFPRSPQRYTDAITAVIRDVATRAPAFANELRVLAQQANIAQPGSNVVTIKNDAPNQGAQGTFHAPVSFGMPPKADEG